MAPAIVSPGLYFFDRFCRNLPQALPPGRRHAASGEPHERTLQQTNGRSPAACQFGYPVRHSCPRWCTACHSMSWRVIIEGRLKQRFERSDTNDELCSPAETTLRPNFALLELRPCWSRICPISCTCAASPAPRACCSLARGGRTPKLTFYTDGRYTQQAHEAGPGCQGSHHPATGHGGSLRKRAKRRESSS